ncbi:unnamed protein product [Ectocarpus sp. CCAP 1310/34]|nr:unnamed protein product [Ectocarpus sp. CCAP 1310/34]
MSFGFLTESALLPAKSKPIKVDGRSLVDLKAIVYAKEQKVKLEGGGGSAGGGLRGLRGKRSSGDRDGGGGARKDPFARSNRGVEDRSQRDEIERVTASKKRKAGQRVMAAKSSLYEKLAKGEIGGATRAGSLVDFSRKTGDDLALLEAKAAEPTEHRHRDDGKPGSSASEAGDSRSSGGRKKRQRNSGGRTKKRGGGSESRSDSGEEGTGDDDGDFYDGSGGGYGGEVEIVDEFGRHRTVTRGGREHREHLKAKTRAAEIESERQEFEQNAAAAAPSSSSLANFDDRYSYRGNTGAAPPPPKFSSSSSSSSSTTAGRFGSSSSPAPTAATVDDGPAAGGWAWSSGAGRGADEGDFETREGEERRAKKGMAELLGREAGGKGDDDAGAKIRSQWEQTLSGDQKTYLRQVQEETEAVRRQATAKAKAGGGQTGREKQRAERKELLRRKQEARAARLRGESA